MTAAIGTSLCARAMNKRATRARWSGLVMKLSTLVTTFLFVFALACGITLSAQRNTPDKNSPLGQIEVLIRQNRLDEAKTKTMEEIQRNPSSVDAYNMLGMIEGERQDFAGAETSFQKALKLQPGSTRTRNNLGSLYVAE